MSEDGLFARGEFEEHIPLEADTAVEIEHDVRPESRKSERVISLTLSFEEESVRDALVEELEITRMKKSATRWVCPWPQDDPDRPALF